MARLHRRGPALLLTTLIAAVALGGCGSSAPSDQAQIATLVRDEGTKPASLCRRLSDPLLARFGGLSNCLSRAGSAARDPSTHATGVRIRGRSATAVVSDRTGRRSITLVKQKGTWLISGVQ